jgi:asparagine synthetase B (glutamine-hydrolysing)
MCGIISFLSLDGTPVSRADIQLSASMIAHRGPDGAGVAIFDEGRVASGTSGSPRGSLAGLSEFSAGEP